MESKTLKDIDEIKLLEIGLKNYLHIVKMGFIYYM